MSFSPDLARPGKKFDRSVSMLAWGYNEEKLIGGFLEKALALMEAKVEDFEIIFVNDGSADRTGEIAASWAAKDRRIKVVTHPRNMNVGYACRTAVSMASKEFLFWETVDWSYDLSNIRIFLELLKHFDVVQCVRSPPFRRMSYIPILRSIYRIRSRSDNVKAALISLTNYYVLRILYGVAFQDFQNVTFYPTKLAQSLDLYGTSSFINPELLIKAYMSGARFIEVPVRFFPRTAGKAMGTAPRAILRSVRDIFTNWFKWGASIRRQNLTGQFQPIRRVSEPFLLDDEVLFLVLPLFKEYRPRPAHGEMDGQ